MKKLKNILAVMIIILCTFIMTGCGEKKVITAERFISYMKEKGFDAVDIIDNLSYPLTGAKNACYSTNAQQNTTLSFVVFDDNDNADLYYKDTISSFSTDANDRYDENEDEVKTSNIENANYKKYILQTKYSYVSVTRVDNTVLAVQTTANRKALIGYVDDLGY